jgi:hypothetical protein
MNTQALIQLWNVTQRHHGTSGGRAAAGVLLGLYNGGRFPMDLTDLRVMDSNNLKAALAVMQEDASRCQMEVHEYGRKGKCKKEHLDPVSPKSLLIGEPATASA